MKHFLISNQVDKSIFMVGLFILKASICNYLDCFDGNDTSTRNILPVDVGSTIS